MLSVPERYRQTDRRTDGRTTYDSNTALALRASRGKNHSELSTTSLATAENVNGLTVRCSPFWYILTAGKANFDVAADRQKTMWHLYRDEKLLFRNYANQCSQIQNTSNWRLDLILCCRDHSPLSIHLFYSE